MRLQETNLRRKKQELDLFQSKCIYFVRDIVWLIQLNFFPYMYVYMCVSNVSDRLSLDIFYILHIYIVYYNNLYNIFVQCIFIIKISTIYLYNLHKNLYLYIYITYILYILIALNLYS